MSARASLPQHKTATMKVADLLPASYNPRRISDKALAGLRASMVRFGAVQPIVVNTRGGGRPVVVGGHQRLRVMRDLGETECEVKLVDLSPIEEKALNLTLNNPAIAGEFTGAVDAIIEEIRAEVPEVADALRLEEIEFGDGGGGGSSGSAGGGRIRAPRPTWRTS